MPRQYIFKKDYIRKPMGDIDYTPDEYLSTHRGEERRKYKKNARYEKKLSLWAHNEENPAW